MGAKSSRHLSEEPSRSRSRHSTSSVAQGQGFRPIPDSYGTLSEVQGALRTAGLESSSLLVAVDFTKSNEWNGKHSFWGNSLHSIGSRANPYEEAISAIGRTLASFDDDGLIPSYGFGDAVTGDVAVFSFMPNNQPCQSLDTLVHRYRELAPHVRLAGPTSFAPAIYEAIRAVAASGNQYHILLLVADGQVTRSSDTSAGFQSPQELATSQAIVAASQFPLSIVMVGVGDGPWDTMQAFDDGLPSRRFDNFQFVRADGRGRTHHSSHGHRHSHPPASEEGKDAAFALAALMEVPAQYQAIQRLGLLRRPFSPQEQQWLSRLPRPLDPPGPAPSHRYPTTPDLAHQPMAPPGKNAQSPAASTSAAPPQQASPPSKTQQPPVPSPTPSSNSNLPDTLLLCPITQEVMQDPVIAADGHCYERAAIANWLTNHDTSPMTNAPMAHKMLTPNHQLRSAALEYLQRQGAQ
ncbi:MAG: hypothetical protein WDW36_008156 [Sanguina aurantia]